MRPISESAQGSKVTGGSELHPVMPDSPDSRDRTVCALASLGARILMPLLPHGPTCVLVTSSEILVDFERKDKTEKETKETGLGCRG